MISINPWLKMPGWWNWQTHTFEGRRPSGMGVQIPPPALPQINSNCEMRDLNSYIAKRHDINILSIRYQIENQYSHLKSQMIPKWPISKFEY
jgi:hypothetical protein